MNASLIELADGRRQDMLNDAARERLVREARPDQSLALPALGLVRFAAPVVFSAVRGVVAALSFHAFKRGSMRGEQTMLPSAR